MDTEYNRNEAKGFLAALSSRPELLNLTELSNSFLEL